MPGDTLDNCLEADQWYEQEFFGPAGTKNKSCADQVVEDIRVKLFSYALHDPTSISMPEQPAADEGRDCKEIAGDFVDNLWPCQAIQEGRSTPTVSQSNAEQEIAGPLMKTKKKKRFASDSDAFFQQAMQEQGSSTLIVSHSSTAHTTYSACLSDDCQSDVARQVQIESIRASLDRIVVDNQKELQRTAEPEPACMSKKEGSIAGSLLSRSQKCVMVALEADESLDAPVTKHTNGHLRSFACLDPSADENLSQDPELYGDRSTQPTIHHFVPERSSHRRMNYACDASTQAMAFE